METEHKNFKFADGTKETGFRTFLTSAFWNTIIDKCKNNIVWEEMFLMRLDSNFGLKKNQTDIDNEYEWIKHDDNNDRWWTMRQTPVRV